jgi:ABC-type transporter lipoprotein component MlaA
MDYDPWESFNERTFSFNFNVLDRYALKLAAKVVLNTTVGVVGFFDAASRFSRVNAESRVPSPQANTTAARADWDLAIANLRSQGLSSRQDEGWARHAS